MTHDTHAHLVSEDTDWALVDKLLLAAVIVVFAAPIGLVWLGLV